MTALIGAGRETLRRLLRAYNEQPDEREAIVVEIRRRFQRDAAVLVLDTCGFSRTVRAKGIVHFLALLERLERLARPLIAQHAGRVLKIEADDIFAVFPDPDHAVACAEAIVHNLDIANEALPARDELNVSIGIGYGEVLLIGDDDLYGDEMNIASKLGEDVAGQNEVLLTPAAHAALTSTDRAFQPFAFSVSGLELTAYRLMRRGVPAFRSP